MGASRIIIAFTVSLCAGLLSSGCTSDGSCTVSEDADGATVISCPDGTRATVPNGADGASCSVADNGDGTKTVSCDDGSSARISDGASCTVLDNADGTKTLSCEDGTRIVVADGAQRSSCSVVGNADGTVTVACTDGTSATLEGRPGGTFEGDYVVESAVDAIVLAGFSSVTGSLTIHSSSLTTVGPQKLVGVTVDRNPALKTLAGLELLADVGGKLWIVGNDVLTDVAGFVGLERLGGDLTIAVNPALPQCEAAALEGRLVAGGWSGRAIVAGNDEAASCPEESAGAEGPGGPRDLEERREDVPCRGPQFSPRCRSASCSSPRRAAPARRPAP